MWWDVGLCGLKSKGLPTGRKTWFILILYTSFRYYFREANQEADFTTVTNIYTVT